MRSAHIRHIAELDDLELLRARHERHRFVAHCHPTFVIQRVDCGADWCELNGIAAGPGDVWVHLPAAVHTGGTVGDRELRYSAIYPTLRLAADLLDLGSAEVPTNASFVLRDHECSRLLARLFACDDHSIPQVSVLVREILQHVLAHAHDPSIVRATDHSGANAVAAERARQHLARHCERNVTTSELSELCGLSPSHLIRQFKAWIGITPRQFLISQRVARAKSHLDRGLPILEAALAAGFADQSHMNRCFRRVAGYSPGNYVA